MTYFCPCCWTKVSGDQRTCTRCGTQIEREWEKKTYVQKLIAALRHTEPTTPIRAAWILGQLRAREAVPALTELAQSSFDPFLREATVAALGEISDPATIELLQALSRSRSVLVRRAAVRALAMLGTRLAAGGRQSQSPPEDPSEEKT